MSDQYNGYSNDSGGSGNWNYGNSRNGNQGYGQRPDYQSGNQGYNQNYQSGNQNYGQNQYYQNGSQDYNQNQYYQNGNQNYGQNQYYQNGNQGYGYGQNRGYGQDFNVRSGAANETLTSYVAKTFGWMAAGLLVTFLVAMATAYSGLWYYILAGGAAGIVILSIAEIAVVIYMSARVRKISVGGARACFFAYAALTGLTFSIYFIAFNAFVITYAFLATALFFGGMAAAAIFFKLQLDSIRPYLFGSLIFLLIFGLVAFFTGFSWMQIAECYIGIFIFLAYTAYDTTKVRDDFYFYQGNAAILAKASIYSALQLYLDFINLFIRILRIFGKRN